tara:strand:+ start:3619 stop:3798 length:180 start_codon:yes stop_codon:yes gene_type:complete
MKGNKMEAEEALGIAFELVSDRLDLIRQRELDERDGVEEGRLKEALSYLEETIAWLKEM